MERATVSQLRKHLRAYLDKARAGETVLVVEAGEVLARLEAPHAGDVSEHWERLEREGIIRFPDEAVPLERLRRKAPVPQASVLEALVEERREGR